jgi:NitT/TauT family transport system permease protein
VTSLRDAPELLAEPVSPTLRPLATVSPEERREARKRRRNHALLVWATRIVLIVVLLVAWQVISVNKIVDPTLIGYPSGIWHSFVHEFTTSVVTTDLKTTLYETFVGFILSSILGMVIAYILASQPFVYEVVRPLITILNSVPRIALVPLFIVWFGLGPESKIANVLTFVTFVVLMNSLAVFQGGDRDLLQLARTLGFNERQRMRKFVLPAAVPVLASTLELALIYSFLGSITAEMLGGVDGLGVRLQQDANQFATNDFFAVLILVAGVTTLVVQALHILQKRLLKWHEIEMRGEHG